MTWPTEIPADVPRNKTLIYAYGTPSGMVSNPYASAYNHQQDLARFCQAYSKPVYFFVLKRGRSTEEVEDLTQAFFADL